MERADFTEETSLWSDLKLHCQEPYLWGWGRSTGYAEGKAGGFPPCFLIENLSPDSSLYISLSPG